MYSVLVMFVSHDHPQFLLLWSKIQLYGDFLQNAHNLPYIFSMEDMFFLLVEYSELYDTSTKDLNVW